MVEWASLDEFTMRMGNVSQKIWVPTHVIDLKFGLVKKSSFLNSLLFIWSKIFQMYLWVSGWGGGIPFASVPLYWPAP